jgi:hypothetical protein
VFGSNDGGKWCMRVFSLEDKITLLLNSHSCVVCAAD